MHNTKERKKLSSESLAVLAIDGIAMAGLIKDKDFDKAVEIATEEIDVRKAAGDYFVNHDRHITSESLADLIVRA